MKIIFLCGSLEPGKDGVGDYTRRLCGALIRRGHQAEIISLCDKQADGFFNQTQMIEGTPVNVRRIPIATSYKQRLALTQETIKEVAPDWISLQYVPYSFDPKGLPFWLPGFLKNLTGKYQWHIMFHEVANPMNSLINLFTRVLQFIIIIKLNNKIKVSSINTSLDIYKKLLSKINIQASLLNLFSNIPLDDKKFIKDKEAFIIGFFSQMEPIPLIVSALERLMSELNDYKVKILLIGGNNDKVEHFREAIKSNTKINVEIEKTGFINDSDISSYLKICDVGVTPIQSKILSKSGSAAAFIEHGIPVYAPNYVINGQSELEIVFNKEFRIFNNLTLADLKTHCYSQRPNLLDITVNQFVTQFLKND